MKRLDTINEHTAKIYTLLRRFVKCTCADALHQDDDEEVIEPLEEWLTINEALVILKISRGTLYTLRKNGQIASRVMNRSVRLLKSDVEEALVWYSVPKGKV